MREWIEWGYRQGGTVTSADDQATASQQVEVLQFMGEDAELVHRIVTMTPGTGVQYQKAGGWTGGPPVTEWATVYVAARGGVEAGVFPTSAEAWSHLAPSSAASPPSYVGTVRVHKAGAGAMPHMVNYSVTVLDMPSRDHLGH